LRVAFEEILEIAAKAKLEIVGFSAASALTEEATKLRIWQENGFAADMKWMQRDPLKLADPLHLLPEAKSVISVAVAYDRRMLPSQKAGYGRVARYAWGKDYHLVLKSRIEDFAKLLSAEFGEFKSRSFTDAVPLLERAFAKNAGLGFIGKNTLLIKPKLGSFTLLAELISDLEIENLPIQKKLSGCGTCTKCIKACPTNAIKSAYVLDANKCISYLSIEKRGNLSEEERGMLGQWIFGCDICQDVCPYNHSQLKQQFEAQIPEFGYEFGVGPWLSLERVCSIANNQEFKSNFKDSPVIRAKREGLIRNAICVAVNTGYGELKPSLEKLSLDSSELVRDYASWGLGRLS
jgi:epoxyqueuosine reductase